MNDDYDNARTDKEMSERFVRYPDITVTPKDGNAYAILGATQRALRAAGVSAAEISEYMTTAMGGDYDNLLRVTMVWVDLQPSDSDGGGDGL